MAEQTTEALQAQIAQLEEQLAATRSESGQNQSAPYERSEVHAAVGEQIRAQMPVSATPAPAPTATPPPVVSSGGKGKSWQDPALAATVQDLVNIAFTQGLAVAVAKAVLSGNAALIDAFHDVLADELHQELLNRQKLAPAA